VRRYYQKLSWISASFAISLTSPMGAMGGSLKQKRDDYRSLCRHLSWMFLSTSVLRRWEAEGRREEDLPIVQYALKLGLANIQHAFDGIFANLEVPFMGWLFNGVLRIWSKTNALGGEIKDGLTHDVAQVILQDSAQRDRSPRESTFLKRA